MFPLQAGPRAPAEDAEARHDVDHGRKTGQGHSPAGLDALHPARLHSRRVASRHRDSPNLGVGRQGGAGVMLASDRPTRGRIGQDDQIQPLQCPRRYASAPSGPDAGAALLGRARFRRRQGRVRPSRLSSSGMEVMASPRHDGDVGDAVHPRTTRGATTGPRIVDATRHRGDAQRNFAAQAGRKRGAGGANQRTPPAPPRRHRIPFPHPTQEGFGLSKGCGQRM